MSYSKLEPDKPLLTVVRCGMWSLATVAQDEVALRRNLRELHNSGHSTSLIIDIRSSGAQARNVADSLRTMAERLGRLHAERATVIANSGLAKSQAIRVANATARLFSSMVRSRDWVMGAGSIERLKLCTMSPVKRTARTSQFMFVVQRTWG